MKVALLSQTWPDTSGTPVAGSSVQVHNVAREFARRGHDVLVILSNHPGFSTLHEEHLRVEAILPPFGTQAGLLFTRWMKRVVSALDAFGPDIVYQRGKVPETVAAARYCRRCTARFAWLSNAENSGERWKFVKKRLAKRQKWLVFLPLMADAFLADLLIEAAVRKADIAIAQTAHQQERIRANFGLSPAVIGSGYPVTPCPLKRNARPRVLWLANLTPMKQPDLFLELARRLAGEEADFVMAGHAEPGPLLTAVRAAHNELPSFQYGGPVTLTQANALFAEADLFISTSGSRPEYAEGLPNTFVQACLHATPILSLQHDPDRLISDNHIGEIAKSLDELTEKTRSWIRDNDKRRETGSRAYELATQRFNIETIVDQLLEAVKER